MSLFDRTIKREIPLFSYYDFSGMARHLEEMAHRGWQLESIGGQFWRPPLSPHGNAVRGGVF